MKPPSQSATATTTDTAGDQSRKRSLAGKGPGGLTIDNAVFKDVNVTLNADMGQTEISVEELLALKAGSVVKLDLKLGELIDLRLNQNLIARGEIVAVDDNFGVRIVELADKP